MISTRLLWERSAGGQRTRSIPDVVADGCQSGPTQAGGAAAHLDAMGQAPVEEFALEGGGRIRTQGQETGVFSPTLDFALT
jgi:hypothetical protein